MTRRPIIGAVVLTLAVVAGSCSDRQASGAGDPTTTTITAADDGTPGAMTDALACDPLDTAACALPFPNDAFTRADASAATGRRVAFGAETLPANTAGHHVDPTEWNRNDGFSPSAIPMTVVPGLDATATGLPPVGDIARSLDAGSPTVLWDATAGVRLAHWAELDANAPATPADRSSAPRQSLLIVPAAALADGHRIVVGLRSMKGADGAVIPVGEAFRAYRDGTAPATDARVPSMNRLLGDLDRAGVPRAELFLAWDFTVASTADLTGRLVAMRDDALATLPDGVPPFVVTEDDAQGDAHIVRGTFAAPSYLSGDGGPGSVLNNRSSTDAAKQASGEPVRNGSITVPFTCVVPTAASAASPARYFLYGHGLLGSRDEVEGLGSVAATVNVGSCAVDWIGMSRDDVGAVATALGDLSAFPTVPDRLQQSHLDFVLLGRLLRAPTGFASDPAFGGTAAAPAIDQSELYFLGASQGGILGAATSAIATDWKRVILAVPGIGYSLLLRRSVDFAEFAPALAASYPDATEQTLLLGVMQMLWDRGENSGYAQHLTTDPLPGAPAKTVLLLEAFGDHQVANVSTEKLARTVGAALRTPGLAAGRSGHAVDFFGINPIPAFPDRGSGLVMWDFGTPAPPDTNTVASQGSDPHGKLGDEPRALLMVESFFRPAGTIIDVCDGAPCSTPPG